ncbi:hypothetical protein Gogos_004642 [Gossypium gossypioides]|uniref:Uncharacterized protein n=1 Tax=Gossypium gossypioides TaxID=34282 RepID=A0A7J9CHH1_GOSGO|nr:hypothetical protein [Gossypium gossypioides]
MSRLHNRNCRSHTKMVPHFQRRRKRFMMEVNKFLLQLLMLPCYWESASRKCSKIIYGLM